MRTHIYIDLSFDGEHWYPVVYEGAVQHLREHLACRPQGRRGLLVLQEDRRLHMDANYIRFPGGRVWSLAAQGWVDND